MGIKGLKKFLREQFPQVCLSISFSHLYGKKIAVDISSYIYKYKTKMGEQWLKSFFQFLCLFKKHHVHGIFLFDGIPPKEKDRERQRRKQQREMIDEKTFRLALDLETYKETLQVSDLLWETYTYIQSHDTSTTKIHRLLHGSTSSSSSDDSSSSSSQQQRVIDPSLLEAYITKKEAQLIHITSEDLSDLKQLIERFGGIVMDAPGEAETLGSYLCSIHQCDGILTEDSDVLAYGTDFYMSELNLSTETCMVIPYPLVLRYLGLSSLEFLDFCILCGTDYNTNIPGIGIKNAYRLIHECHSIEGIQTHLQKDISMLNYERVRTLFRSFGCMDTSVYQSNKIEYWDPNVDPNLLLLFLRTHKIWCSESLLHTLWSNPLKSQDPSTE